MAILWIPAFAGMTDNYSHIVSLNFNFVNSLSYCEFDYVPSESFIVQLSEVIDSRIAFLTSKDYLAMSRLILSELLRGRKLNQLHLEKIERIDGHFVRWVDAAKKDGQIRDQYDSWFISKQFHSLIKGHVFYPVVEGFISPKDVDVDSLKKFVIDFFMRFFCSAECTQK